MQKKTGILYVVATPIGNLQDITLRAIEILKTVDLVAAEDTRHSAALLKHLSIHKPSISLHEYNEKKRLTVLLEALAEGKHIALISDAGTPLISDPGFSLIKEAKQQNIQVVPIPGPCAAITALCAAGLATDRFVFEGFLPAKNHARRQRLVELMHEKRTLIFYEAPHRVLSTLQDMAEIFGEERVAVLARELTKRYESIINDHLSRLIAHLEKHPTEQRGEIVILVDGVKESVTMNQIQVANVLALLLTELPVKKAAALASKITGEPKNVLYKMALNKKGQK